MYYANLSNKAEARALEIPYPTTNDEPDQQRPLSRVAHLRFTMILPRREGGPNSVARGDPLYRRAAMTSNVCASQSDLEPA